MGRRRAASRKHFCVLRYDQRGAGLSEKVRQDFTNDMLVEDFEALAESSGPQAALSFCHCRSRSDTSVAFSGKAPRPRGALVLCNPAPGVDASRAAALDERAAFAMREGMRASLPTTLALSYPPQLGERAAYEAYLGRYLANDPVGFGLAFRCLARTNMLHMLPQIRCPVMVVAGRHDTVRPHAGTAELAKKIPGARFELIEEAGHFMPSTGAASNSLALLDEIFVPTMRPPAQDSK